MDTDTLPEQEAPHGGQIGPETPIDFGPSLGLGPKLTRPPLKRIVLPLIIVVCLIAIGFGVYWQFLRNSPHTTQSKQAVSHTVSSSHTTVTNEPTQSYTATDFNLSFNYPKDWTVVNSGTGPMTVTSPSMQLTSATGQAVPGLIIMTIQQQGQLPASFSAGTALAVLNSQEITYTQPTSSQASQTYLSFVQYSSTNTKGGLDGIYVTGNDGYQKDQVIPDTDVAGVNPLITITFTKCGNSACTANLSPLTIASTSWNNTAFKTPIVTMLRSFAFQ